MTIFGLFNSLLSPLSFDRFNQFKYQFKYIHLISEFQGIGRIREDKQQPRRLAQQVMFNFDSLHDSFSYTRLHLIKLNFTFHLHRIFHFGLYFSLKNVNLKLVFLAILIHIRHLTVILCNIGTKITLLLQDEAKVRSYGE